MTSIEHWVSCRLLVLELFVVVVRNTILGGNITTTAAGLLPGEEGERAGLCISRDDDGLCM